MSIAVIIPVLNEQKGLPALLLALMPLGFEELIVVDGGSRDGTVDVARRMFESASDSRFELSTGRVAGLPK